MQVRVHWVKDLGEPTEENVREFLIQRKATSPRLLATLDGPGDDRLYALGQLAEDGFIFYLEAAPKAMPLEAHARWERLIAEEKLRRVKLWTTVHSFLKELEAAAAAHFGEPAAP
jgi:hypothetical protein